MRPHLAVGLPLLLLVALGPGLAQAFGGDPAAEAALKEKGLSKAGRVFVIEAEKPVLAKIKEVRAAYAGYASLASKQAAAEHYEAQSAHLEEQRLELKANLDDLNQRIIEQATSPLGNGPQRPGPGNGPPGGAGAASPLIPQRDQVKSALAEVTASQKALKSEAPVVKDKAALDDEVKKKAEAFKSALADLRKMVDDVTAKYAELADDDSVKKPLADLEKAAKAKVKLGPSDAFLAGVKELDQAERRFLGKKPTAPARKSKAKSKAR
jgi:DNA repair exonuclease SbcCD ATPase subunit